MKEITLEDVRELRRRFDAYTETAEPQEFPLLLMIDIKFTATLKQYEETGVIDDQKEARAMFRVVLRIIGGDPSEYAEAQNAEDKDEH